MQTLRRGETLEVRFGGSEQVQQAKFLSLHGHPRGGLFEIDGEKCVIFSAELSAGWVTIERATQKP